MRPLKPTLEYITESALSNIFANIKEADIKDLANVDFTDITDAVFLAIERDQELEQMYRKIVAVRGVNSVNISIGKFIRADLDLTNIGRGTSPESRLIGSYEKHGLGSRTMQIIKRKYLGKS